jgi:GDP-mannose transporter
MHTHTHARTHTHTHRVFIWYVVFSVDQLYIKFIINKTKQLMTTWGRVFVTNALGAAILAPLVLLGNEPATLAKLDWHEKARVGWFLTSIAVGVCMGYFAMSARTAVSATYFTVIGNVCKILTVFVNFFIWDHHASPVGLASLGVCLIAAYFYEQAPLVKTKAKQSEARSTGLQSV